MDYQELKLRYSRDLAALEERERTAKARMEEISKELNLPQSVKVEEVEAMLEKAKKERDASEAELHELMAQYDRVINEDKKLYDGGVNREGQ